MPSDSLPTLLVIDVQRAFDDPGWGPRNNPQAESAIAELLAAWRDNAGPVMHVRHRSTSEAGLFKGPGFDFKPEAAPLEGEPVIEKTVNSAFIGTDLEDRLRREGAKTLVIAGLTTDHCCSTTARMAANLGFETWFVSEATATFERRGPDGAKIDAETMHRTALASLQGEFAEVLDVSQSLAKLQARRHDRRT
jgi:nicotinamidase-related amidase